MARDIPVGNGQLLVGFDRHYALRDLYWPHVGMENHVMGRRCRVGVLAEGRPSWIGDERWRLDLGYEDDTLVTRVDARSESLGLHVTASDAVDWQRPILVRRFLVRNLTDGARTLRIVLHHDLDIQESDAGNTVYYDPPLRAVIHYKRRRYFLVNLRTAGRTGVPEWSCDHRNSHGGRGTAGLVEDGRPLDGNPISLGAVDSVVGLELLLAPRGEAVVHDWIAVGTKYSEVAAENAVVEDLGPDGLLERTRAFWRSVCQDEARVLAALPPEVAAHCRRSLLVIRTQADRGGGILAANDSDTLDPGRETYSYVWPRDGAFIAATLSRAGDSETARRFFRFCEQHLSAGGYFLQRYHPDGSLASSWLPWIRDGREVLPIQEDETALVLWALKIHVDTHRDLEFASSLYPGLVRPAAEFLAGHRSPVTGMPLPSWDLWEERLGLHAFTAAAVVAGLRAAAALAELFGEPAPSGRWREAAATIDTGIDRYLYHHDLGRYARTGYPQGDGYYLDTCVDASLAGLFLLGVRADSEPRLAATMAAVRKQLAVPTGVGGIARYEGDPYCRPPRMTATVPGNPWFLVTLWVAEWEIQQARTAADLEATRARLDWARRKSLPSGVMSEQLHPETGQPESVSPLTWSHAAYLSAALRYLERRTAIDRP